MENNKNQTVAINVGHSINPKQWDSEQSRVKKILIDTAWKAHSVELKVIQGKKVIFLSMEESNKLYNLVLPEDNNYLERVRDVFCFNV